MLRTVSSLRSNLAIAGDLSGLVSTNGWTNSHRRAPSRARRSRIRMLGSPENRNRWFPARKEPGARAANALSLLHSTGNGNEVWLFLRKGRTSLHSLVQIRSGRGSTAVLQSRWPDKDREVWSRQAGPGGAGGSRRGLLPRSTPIRKL